MINNTVKKKSYLTIALSIFLIIGYGLVEPVSSANIDKSKKKFDKSKKKIDNSVEVQMTRLYIDANRAKLIDDIEEAEKLFKDVLNLDPDNSAAKYELARIYLNSGQHDLALILAKEASKKEPSNKWYKMLYADLLAYNEDFKQAAELYEQIIYENPDEYELHFEWAYFLIQAGKYQNAIDVYNMLENKVGLDDNVIYQKQKLYLQMDDIESAAAEVQKLIDKYPNAPEYYGVLAEMYEANDHIEKARELYLKVLSLDPQSSHALIALADISLKEGDREEYMKNMKKIFQDTEVSIDVKIRVLYSYIQEYEKGSEKVSEAIELAALLVEAHPDDAKSYSIKGDIFYMTDRLEEALSAYNNSLDYTKDIFTVWQNIMIIQSELKKNEALIESSSEAMELFPLQPLPYLFNGIAYQQLERYQNAIKPLSKGIKVTLDNAPLKAQFFSNLGDIYQELKQNSVSDSCYDESIKLDPENPYVLNNYSYYLSLRGSRLEDAKKMAEKANEIESGNAAFQDTYAWILYKTGNYKEAKVWQQKALENGGEERPVLLEHYGDILFKLGEINKAVEYWQKAMEKGSDSAILGRKIADRKLYEE